MRIKLFIFILLLALLIPTVSQAKITIASGAGYRSLVDDIAAQYTLETGKQVELIYGNMARVTAQARNSGVVDMVLGDKSFLDKSGLDFKSEEKVGRGKLVIAYPKGKKYTDAKDLLSPKVSRIALPDTKRAIYGKAAMQFLKNKGIFKETEPKLLMVATVPQSASYIVAGEVDYAFINMTHARKIRNSIGGYVAVDESAYSPISIIIRQMNHSNNSSECGSFIKFLKSESARKIVAAHGM